MIRNAGGEVFLDLKFRDIPRTVAKAPSRRRAWGVRMFDVHASGSLEMMQRTVSEVTKVCRSEGLRRPKVLAVTVLTSLNRDDLKRVGVAELAISLDGSCPQVHDRIRSPGAFEAALRGVAATNRVRLHHHQWLCPIRRRDVQLLHQQPDPDQLYLQRKPGRVPRRRDVQRVQRRSPDHDRLHL
jgi:hypothetical protein